MMRSACHDGGTAQRCSHKRHAASVPAINPSQSSLILRRLKNNQPQPELPHARLTVNSSTAARANAMSASSSLRGKGSEGGGDARERDERRNA